MSFSDGLAMKVDRVGVPCVDLVLAVPGLPLRELDWDAGAMHSPSNGAEVLLVHRGREHVVVEDVGDCRSQSPVVLLVRLGVALFIDIELELGREQRRVAQLLRPLVLRDQDLAWRCDDRRAVVIRNVTQHERRAIEPGHAAQRRHVGHDREIAVTLLPVGHLVAGHGIHVHVEREQVVAALDPVLDDVVEKILRLDALPEKATLHVGEGGDDGVDRARFDLLAQVIEREHSGRAAGTARPRAAVCRGQSAVTSSSSSVRTGPV
jgi:hypothetical protein